MRTYVCMNIYIYMYKFIEINMSLYIYALYTYLHLPNWSDTFRRGHVRRVEVSL